MLILLLNSKLKSIDYDKNIQVLFCYTNQQIFLSIAAFGQNTIINGTVKNSTSGDGVPAVSVTVKGSGAGTYHR